MRKYLCASEDCKEKLRDHLLGVGNCCSFLIKFTNLNINPSLGLVAGSLHDIGKGIELYQNEEYYNIVGSFVGHEYISALVAKYLTLSMKLKVEEQFIIIYSILMHHQALGPVHDRLDSFINKYNEVKERFKGDKEILKFRDEIIGILEKALGSMCNKEDIYASISRCESTLQDIVNRVYVEDPATAYLYVLPDNVDILRLPTYVFHLARNLCGILMVCDKYIASKAREGKRDPYYLSVEDLLKGLGYRELEVQ